DETKLGVHQLLHREKQLRGGYVGHFDLVLEADFIVVKARLHVVDGATVLDGHDATRAETASVANTVHLVESGGAGIAGAQEVRVQRVHPPGVYGASRRHQGLRGHLPTEGSLAVSLRVLASEDVDLNVLEVQQVNEKIESNGHRSIVSASTLRWLRN